MCLLKISKIGCHVTKLYKNIKSVMFIVEHIVERDLERNLMFSKRQY